MIKIRGHRHERVSLSIRNNMRNRYYRCRYVKLFSRATSVSRGNNAYVHAYSWKWKTNHYYGEKFQAGSIILCRNIIEQLWALCSIFYFVAQTQVEKSKKFSGKGYNVFQSDFSLFLGHLKFKWPLCRDLNFNRVGWI